MSLCGCSSIQMFHVLSITVQLLTPSSRMPLDLEMRRKLDICSGKSEALLTCLLVVLEPYFTRDNSTQEQSRTPCPNSAHPLTQLSAPTLLVKGKYVSQLPGLVCLQFLFSLLKLHSRNFDAYSFHYLPTSCPFSLLNIISSFSNYPCQD